VRLHVLRSPTGGGRESRRASDQLLGELAAAGHEIIDVTGGSSDETSENLQHLIDGGEVDRVLVCGGDGLVHLAVQHLALSGVPMALCPSGSGNDFATALGIHTPDVATTVASARPIDLIKVTTPNGFVSWVASIAIAGFPASINERANKIRLPIGSQIYTLAAALELPRFGRLPLSLRLDGHQIETDSAMLAIGNTKLFGGGMVACPDATAVDGLVHLTSIQHVGRLGILRHLARRGGGTADRPEVLRRTARRIDVDTPGIAMWADGEPLGEAPLSFEVISEALLVPGLASPAS